MHQSKSFITYINNKRSFNLTVFGFSIILTWNVNINIKRIRLLISSLTLISKFTTALLIKKIKFTITNSLIKLLMKFTMPLSIKKIVLSSSMKQFMKFLFNFKVTKVTITGLMKLFTKLGSWLPKIPRIRFTLSPIVANFIALWVYDPQTLASMDSISLEDLDYVVA